MTAAAFEQAAAAFRPRTRRWPTPGAMARHFEPTTRQTPALLVIDEHLVGLYEHSLPIGEGKRLLIAMPPQEGKSQRTSRWFPAWLLSIDPTLRIGLMSYSSDLAVRWGRAVRRLVNDEPDIGVTLRRDTRRANEWETIHGGGMVTVGRDSGLTGRPLDVLIVDDPFSSQSDAMSAATRENVWSWWESVAVARLSPRGIVAVMNCLTGDTPVLMADGTEKPMRDIHPGDMVATYEGGRLSTSTVRNWVPQGPDTIYEIRMKSGAKVRANARHPFLTIDQDGVETWQRTAQLGPGSSILRATGDSTEGYSARSATATSQQSARACAPRTTAKPAGPLATVLRRLTKSLGHAGTPSSSTATASPSPTASGSWLRRTVRALSVVGQRPTSATQTFGEKSSASTTTTAAAPATAPAVNASEGCSATTATCSSAVDETPNSSRLPLRTWNVQPDEVLEVVPAGVEDVYDVQIDRTENFIANGLVSHNTRWHEDDLSGRLARLEPGRWTDLRIPAIADSPDDPLGRPIGEEMVSAQGRAAGYFHDLQATRSPFVFAAVWQQRPAPLEGGLFRADGWRYWSPEFDNHGQALLNVGTPWLLRDCMRFLTVDLASSLKTSADYTVAAVWAVTPDGQLALLDQSRGRRTTTEHWPVVRSLREKWQADTVYVESRMFGTTLVYEAGRAGIPIEELQADTDKVTRAIPAADRQAQGTLWLPAGAPWLGEWLAEVAAFPNGTHDDQVDVLAYAARVAAAHWVRPVSADTMQAMMPTSPADPRDPFTPSGLDFMAIDY